MLRGSTEIGVREKYAEYYAAHAAAYHLPH